MSIELDIKELVVLWHLLERSQSDENYWSKRVIDFEDDGFYNIELPDSFYTNGIKTVEQANDIARRLKDKLFERTYSRYSHLKP